MGVVEGVRLAEEVVKVGRAGVPAVGVGLAEKVGQAGVLAEEVERAVWEGRALGAVAVGRLAEEELAEGVRLAEKVVKVGRAGVPAAGVRLAEEVGRAGVPAGVAY